jgi:type IV pilus assembly protein PilA
MKKMNKKGFTLVEIMIVVAIIGLLAAIGIPSIIGAYSNAQEKSKERNITEVEKAKAMMTLPVASGGLNYTTNNTPTPDELATALNITNISVMTVGGTAITTERIGLRAHY